MEPGIVYVMFLCPIKAVVAFPLAGGCISGTHKVVPVHRDSFLKGSMSEVRQIPSVSMYYSAVNNITAKFRGVWQWF